MKKRQWDDLTREEQGMVILIDAVEEGDYEYYMSMWVLRQEFDLLIDAPTLGEFDWGLHKKRKIWENAKRKL